MAKLRASGDRGGTERRYVRVSEIAISSPYVRDVEGFVKGLNANEKKAFEKYREEYKRSKERGWRGLPLIGYWKGKMVIDDGTHRFMSAVAEGATEVLCEVDPEKRG